MIQINSLKTRPIVILDFGSQYTQLIARRVREMGVYCEIHQHDAALSAVGSGALSGIILSGGPASVTDDQAHSLPDWVFQLAVPVLGICYGMQAMAAHLGGKVSKSSMREFGRAQVILREPIALLHGLQDQLHATGLPVMDVWMSHGDEVTCLPPGFSVIGETSSNKITVMADEANHWYGLQFHPEVTHTPKGAELLQRFVLQICHAPAQWTATQILEQSLTKIRNTVGTKRVLLGLSGGVDSSVVAALLHRAIGDQLVCVFVDTGLLRMNEAAQVIESFGQFIGSELIAIDAEARFLSALRGITCPEAKRKIIGAMFVEVFEEQASKLSNISFLAQGTIYPDVIESAGAHSADPSDVIKSHHNVAGLPKNMQLTLLEPLRELFKDEVRELGLSLGLPHALVYRHPFPGPGFGVRILGEVKPEYAVTLRKADVIFMEELHAAGLYHQLSQAFAVFLPVKSVGVVGDRRCYEHVICLRAVETNDFMTANWAHLPWDFLGQVSNRIINEVPGISRVTYDISGKPPATIEWE